MTKAKRIYMHLSGNQRTLDEYIAKSIEDKKQRLEQMKREIRELIGADDTPKT
jgi:hypothetical protein